MSLPYGATRVWSTSQGSLRARAATRIAAQGQTSGGRLTWACRTHRSNDVEKEVEKTRRSLKAHRDLRFYNYGESQILAWEEVVRFADEFSVVSLFDVGSVPSLAISNRWRPMRVATSSMPLYGGAGRSLHKPVHYTSNTTFDELRDRDGLNSLWEVRWCLTRHPVTGHGDRWAWWWLLRERLG